jgi:hypothetical protein
LRQTGIAGSAALNASGAATPSLPRVKSEAAPDTSTSFIERILASLSADDFQLVRPHLRTGELTHDQALPQVGETLKRAYLPHRDLI